MGVQAQSREDTAQAREQSLRQLGREGRRLLLRLAARSRSAHLACSLSCLDLLVALYFDAMRIDAGAWEDRDIFVLSKAHAAMALYTVLRLKGLLSEEA